MCRLVVKVGWCGRQLVKLCVVAVLPVGAEAVAVVAVAVIRHLVGVVPEDAVAVVGSVRFLLVGVRRVVVECRIRLMCRVDHR